MNGSLPTSLAGTCVSFNGTPAPLFAVFPNQVNVQVPAVGASSAKVVVTTACGTDEAQMSNAITVGLAAASPEFFYFTLDGSNPIAAVDLTTGTFLGPAGLLPNVNFTSANAGDTAVLFATGLGPTQTPLAAGQIPSGADSLAMEATLSIGGVAVAPADLLYVGAAPGDAGLYQINLRIGSYIPAGNDAVVLTVGGAPAPTSFLPIAVSGLCEPPAIDLFAAAPNQLTASGSVTLNYATENATTVTIGTGPAMTSAVGSQTVLVGTTTFTLSAQNSCGTEQQSVVAAVGVPGIGAISNVSQPGLGASAQPGQLIAIQTTNLAEPAEVAQVVFTTAGVGIESDAPGLDGSGRILVRVPLIADNSAAQGYDTGTQAVSYIFNTQQTGPANLTVTPLSYAGDAAAAFGSILDVSFNAANDAVSGFASDQTFGPMVPGAMGVINSLYGALSTAAAGLETGASVQLPMTLIAGSSASPLTVTMNDITTLMAFNQNPDKIVERTDRILHSDRRNSRR